MNPPRLTRFSPSIWAGALALLTSLPASVFADPIPGLVTDWSLSQRVRVSSIDLERYPDARQQEALSWAPAQSDSTGLVDLARQKTPLTGDAAKVYARTTLHASQAETRAFAFDFSGGLSLYLNGRLLYRGERTLPASPVGAPGRNTLPLPLAPGDNELLLACTPTAGTASFAGRDLDAIYRHRALVSLWELAGVLHAPESVACDAPRQVLYVSNFSGDCISKIGFDGKMLALAWATGLKQPTGLQLFRDRLYAVERSGVAEIDPMSGEVTRRIAIEGAGFPNDLSFDEAGALYVTDTQNDSIYKIVDGRVELLLHDAAIGQPNGGLAEPTRLLVGVTADGTIQAVDLRTRCIDPIVSIGVGALMDGLTADGRGGYLFSDYFGRIFHLDVAGRRVLLLDRSGPRRFCADFAYLPAEGLLVVPSLFDHRLTAYRLKLDEL